MTDQLAPMLTRRTPVDDVVEGIVDYLWHHGWPNATLHIGYRGTTDVTFLARVGEGETGITSATLVGVEKILACQDRSERLSLGRGLGRAIDELLTIKCRFYP